MSVNLNLDPEVLAAATSIAESTGRSVGEVVSELARKGLDKPSAAATATARVEVRDGLPVILTEPPVGPIDLDAVREELEEHGP